MVVIRRRDRIQSPATTPFSSSTALSSSSIADSVHSDLDFNSDAPVVVKVQRQMQEPTSRGELTQQLNVASAPAQDSPDSPADVAHAQCHSAMPVPEHRSSGQFAIEARRTQYYIAGDASDSQLVPRPQRLVGDTSTV